MILGLLRGERGDRLVDEGQRLCELLSVQAGFGEVGECARPVVGLAALPEERQRPFQPLPRLGPPLKPAQRATASTSAGFAGAATSRPAILRTSPPADSQAHFPASLAIPEPTAPSTPATAATDMGSSIPHSPFPTP
ncbi:hypothetical protein OG437_40535 [Streptomyces phaeochromogenes]|uniref:hypothetical protein n=1 Tax=Streptomyces phaeochromogenes TaxID=1923 RepID=UPI002E2ACC96|nr:hypothetical protein [Streptomyces phaeochromogenes]WSJ09478.1 hypothetical protein OG437_40535 [Streptomyces phaeochromogenes]